MVATLIIVVAVLMIGYFVREARATRRSQRDSATRSMTDTPSSPYMGSSSGGQGTPYGTGGRHG